MARQLLALALVLLAPAAPAAVNPGSRTTDGPPPASVSERYIVTFRSFGPAANAPRYPAALWNGQTLPSGEIVPYGIFMAQADQPALSAAGIPPPSYTDPTITPGVTAAKAAHIRELRDLAQ